MFWFAFNPAIKLSKAAKYGDFSYGVYLYAFPIQQLLVSVVPGLTPEVRPIADLRALVDRSPGESRVDHHLASGLEAEWAEVFGETMAEELAERIRPAT